jgi:hypothetical protein
MRLVRYALLLVLIALVAPSAAGALASSTPSGRLGIRAVGQAPAQISVSRIEFALQKGDNATPIGPSTRFAFGPRQIWAFWAWDNARTGSRVNYVLRFGDTDVIWGTLSTDGRSGRMEVPLERLDGDYLMIGRYRLILDASGEEAGNILNAEFEIYDNSSGSDNGNHNNNDNGNGNNNDNGDSNNNNNGNNNDNGNNNANDNGDNSDGDNSDGDNA